MNKNITYWSQVVGPMQGGSWVSGVLVSQPDGSFAVIKPSGKYLSIDTSGNYQEADSVKGSWEKFSISSNLNVLTVTPDLVTYAIYFRQ